MISSEWRQAGWSEDTVFTHGEDFESYIDEILADYIDEFQFSPYPTR